MAYQAVSTKQDLSIWITSFNFTFSNITDNEEMKLNRTTSMATDFMHQEIAPSKNLIHIHFIDSRTVTTNHISSHAIAAK